MSAGFVVANSQYLNNSAQPLVSTGYTFAVGVWCRLRAVSATFQTIFAISDTATANNYFAVRVSDLEVIQLAAAGGGSASNANSANSMTVGAWYFILARAIASDLRRLHILRADGFAEDAQVTTSRSPTGLDTSTIGALNLSTGVTNFWGGEIAELWYTRTDIQNDTGVLSASLVRQLAYGGPFSVPHIAKDILEYRSFRKVIESDQDEAVGDEVYWGDAGRQVWTNTNGVTRGPHPPLPGWYRKQSPIIMPWQNQARTYNWLSSATAVSDPSTPIDPAMVMFA
jgi:hypothetical protein